MRAIDASKKGGLAPSWEPSNPLISPENMWLRQGGAAKRHPSPPSRAACARCVIGSDAGMMDFGGDDPMRMTMLSGLLAGLIGAASLPAAPYPDRPITIVVPFGKGTTADLVAAVVAEAMTKEIGQKVVVELKPGAGGGLALGR